MSIRFVKLLVSIIWNNRTNDTKCLMSLVNAFAVSGNITAKVMQDYAAFDEKYENQVYYFTQTTITKVWRKDL